MYACVPSNQQNRKILFTKITHRDSEYLKDREKEVVDIMMTLFEQEYAVERYGDEKRTEGELKKAKEMALSLFQMGVPIEKIAEAAKLDVGLVRNWLIESGTVGAKNK